MNQFLIEIDDDVPEEELRQVLAHLAQSVQWVAVSPHDYYDHERMFTNDRAWDNVSEAVAESLGDIAQEHSLTISWPPYPYDQWPISQRRLLIHLAVTRWGHLGPNGVDPHLLEADYRAGLLDVFQPQPIQQAIVTGDPASIERLSRQSPMQVDRCHVFENGVVIYDDEGPSILHAYAHQRQVHPSCIPNWHDLLAGVQLDLLYTAARSPFWKGHGRLEHHAIMQFQAQHGNIFPDRQPELN